MTRIAASLVIVVALAASACAGTSSTTTSTMTGPDGAGTDVLFAAALHQLATVDTTFGDGHRFSELLVQSRLDPAAGSATGGGEGRALTAAERAAIEAALAPLGPVRFVDDPDDWRTADLDPVVPGSAILGVGEAEFRTDGEALVPVSMWCGGLCGTWFTYRLVATDGGWTVAGIEGPIAVS